MAKVKVYLKGEEMKEKKEVEKLFKSLKKSEKERLKGFLQGLAFAKAE